MFAIGYIISVLLCEYTRTISRTGRRRLIHEHRYIKIRRRTACDPSQRSRQICAGKASLPTQTACLLRLSKPRLTFPLAHLQSVLAAEVFYPPAIASVKISTLLLYSRIFPSRQFRILLHTVGIFVVTYSGIMVLGAIFQCVPIRGGWDTTVKAKCIKINLLWMIMAGMNVLTDLVLLCAPLPTLWGLQMQRALRLQVMGIFCVGGLYVEVASFHLSAAKISDGWRLSADSCIFFDDD